MRLGRGSSSTLHARNVVVTLVLTVAVMFVPIVWQWVTTQTDTDPFPQRLELADDAGKPVALTDAPVLVFQVDSVDETRSLAHVTLRLDADLMTDPPRSDVVLQSSNSLEPLTFTLVTDPGTTEDPRWRDLTMDLPLAGASAAYPQDHWRTPHFAKVTEPAGLRVITEVSVASGVRQHFVPEAHRIAERAGTAGTPEEQFVDRFRLELHRPLSQVLYVYTIVALPLLLLVAVAIQRRRGVGRTTLTVESGIGVLSLLPLRQVLVPSSITVLTRVDLILAAELIVFVALALGAILQGDPPTSVPVRPAPAETYVGPWSQHP